MSRPPKRVLLTVDAIGGVWQYGLDLARGLGGKGVETVVALLGPAPSPEQSAEMQAVPGAKLVETGLPLDWLCDGPGPVLAAGTAIAQLAKDEQVDLVQLNMPTLGAASMPSLPVIAVTHGCVSTWWQAAKPGQRLDDRYRWHTGMMRDGLRSADHVVAPSASYAQTVARHYGLLASPTVVHNGRTPLVTPVAAPTQDCVLTVGRLWDRVKRADLLDRVAAMLPVPFYAAGPARGPHGEAVQLEHLHVLGEIDSEVVARHLAKRPIFVSAASFEPFGLAVLEAAAAGCALVLADIPTFRELWSGAAIFVEGEDPADYAQAIEALIGDCSLRLKLGDAACARAKTFVPSVMAEAMLGIYSDVLNARLTDRKVAA